MGCDVSDGEIDQRYRPFPDQHQVGRGVIYQPTACYDIMIGEQSMDRSGLDLTATKRRLPTTSLPIPFSPIISLSPSTGGGTLPFGRANSVGVGSGGPQHGIYSRRLTRVSP